MEQQDQEASTWDIFKSVIAKLLVSKSYISLSRLLFYMNLLKGCEDLFMVRGALGRRERTDFRQCAFVLTLFFFLRIFASLMDQNCDFTHPDAQGQRITNK